VAIPIHPLYLLMILLVVLGFIGNSYEFYARSHGWPVSARIASWGIGSIIMVPLSVGIVWYFEGWLAALLAFLGGFVLAWLLTVSLRQHVQVFWVMSMAAVIAGIGIAVVARLVG
jgi:hypothetical protein